MKNLTYVILASVAMSVPCLPAIASSTCSKTASHVHWGYEGEGGPDNWGCLQSEYAKCSSGERQSPIGISLTNKAKLDAIYLNYYPAPLKIINNGHTIQINCKNGSTVSLGNKKYELLQFHFHNPSEHKVNGQSYCMEAHFVHKGEDGKLAVIGVMMEEGKGNDFITTLWNNLPKDTGKEHAVTDVRINANQFFPKNMDYYTYAGSLTTPPCSEIVTWIVLKTPVQVSKPQIEKFTALFKKSARPIQPQHGRTVWESN